LTLQDLGSLGELIGAIGVVISLVYIALQVRQNTRQLDENTRSVQVSALLAARAGSSEFNLRVMSDDELARVYRLGLGNSPKLTPDERIRFDIMLAETFRNYQTLYFLKRDAALPIEEWLSLSKNIEQLLAAPGAAAWWQRTGIPFNKEFVGFVESLLKNA